MKLPPDERLQNRRTESLFKSRSWLFRQGLSLEELRLISRRVISCFRVLDGFEKCAECGSAILDGVYFSSRA